ncbi:phage protein NinX family protein [Scandinavium sp. M-37]|uniref:phage protein NinX family protein n=1 Tax=Scandinavium sp. M-37 TaxID=3373077 RepID=UPI003745491A
MDYGKLSDKEINKLVAFALGCKEVVPDIFMSDERRYEFEKPKNKQGNKFYFDPCNSIADAWPIIAKHRISIEFDGDHSTEPQTTWCHTSNLDRTCGTDYQKNPLRAAMITFLLMQDLPNVQANSKRSDLR